MNKHKTFRKLIVKNGLGKCLANAQKFEIIFRIICKVSIVGHIRLSRLRTKENGTEFSDEAGYLAIDHRSQISWLFIELLKRQ